MYRFVIYGELCLPGLARPRFAGPSLTEVRRAEARNAPGIRVIGGDKGDLFFEGYTLDAESGRTILEQPVLRSSLELDGTEAREVAEEVLLEAFELIGLECVEHA